MDKKNLGCYKELKQEFTWYANAEVIFLNCKQTKNAWVCQNHGCGQRINNLSTKNWFNNYL